MYKLEQLTFFKEISKYKKVVECKNCKNARQNGGDCNELVRIIPCMAFKRNIKTTIVLQIILVISMVA